MMEESKIAGPPYSLSSKEYDDHPHNSFQKEDDLSAAAVRNGFQYDLPQSVEEYVPLSNKPYFCSVRSKFVDMVHILNQFRDRSVLVDDEQSMKRGPLRDKFWAGVISKPKAREWFHELSNEGCGIVADGQVVRKIPTFLQREEAFCYLYDALVPMQRAVWYLKLHAVHLAQGMDQKWKRSQDRNPAVEWTKALLECMTKSAEAAAKTTQQNEEIPFNENDPDQILLKPMIDPLKYFDYLGEILVYMAGECLVDQQLFADWLSEKTVHYLGSKSKLMVPMCQRMMILALKLFNHLERSENTTRLITFYACRTMNVIRSIVEKTEASSDNQQIENEEGKIQENGESPYIELERLFELCSGFVHKVILDYPEALVLVAFPVDTRNHIDMSLALPALSQFEDLPSSRLRLPTILTETLLRSSTVSQQQIGSISAEGAIENELTKIMRANEAKVEARNKRIAQFWYSEPMRKQAPNHPVKDILEFVQFLNGCLMKHQQVNEKHCTSLLSGHKLNTKLLSEVRNFMVKMQKISGYENCVKIVTSILMEWCLVEHRFEAHSEESVNQTYLVAFVLKKLHALCMSGENAAAENIELGLSCAITTFITVRCPEILETAKNSQLVLFKLTLLLSILIESGQLNYGLMLHNLNCYGKIGELDDSRLKIKSLRHLLAQIPITQLAPDYRIQRNRRKNILFGFNNERKSSYIELISKTRKLAKKIHSDERVTSELSKLIFERLHVHDRFDICDRMCRSLMEHFESILAHDEAPAPAVEPLCRVFELVCDIVRGCANVRPPFVRMLTTSIQVCSELTKRSSTDPSMFRLFELSLSVARRYSSLLTFHFRPMAIQLVDCVVNSCEALLLLHSLSFPPYRAVLNSCRILYKRLFGLLNVCQCPAAAAAAAPDSSSELLKRSSAHSFCVACCPNQWVGGVQVAGKIDWTRLDDDENAKRISVFLHRFEKESTKSITEFIELLRSTDPAARLALLSLYDHKIHCSVHLTAAWTRALSSILRSSAEYNAADLCSVTQMLVSRGTLALPSLLTTVIGVVNQSSAHLQRNVAESTSAVDSCCSLIKSIVRCRDAAAGGLSPQDINSVEDSVCDNGTCTTQLLVLLVKHLIAFHSQLRGLSAASSAGGGEERKRRQPAPPPPPPQHSILAIETARTVCEQCGFQITALLTDPDSSDADNVTRIKAELSDRVLSPGDVATISAWLLCGSARTSNGLPDVIARCSVWKYHSVLRFLSLMISQQQAHPERHLRLYQNFCEALVKFVQVVVSVTGRGGGRERIAHLNHDLLNQLPTTTQKSRCR